MSRTKTAAKRGPSRRVHVRVDIPGFPLREIHVRTGERSPKVVSDYRAFIRSLVERRDTDALSAIHAGGQRELRNAFARFNRGEAPVLTASTSKLSAAFASWLARGPSTEDGEPVRPSTLDCFRQAASALLKLASPSAEVEQLPDILWRYRQHCVDEQKNFRFRNARTACLSFARTTERRGIHSPLYKALAEIPNMHARRKRSRAGTLTPSAVRRVMRKMREQGNGHFVQHVWNLAATGCRPMEYFSGHIALVDGEKALFIDGTKTPAARRFIPLLPGVNLQTPTALVHRANRRWGNRVNTSGTLPVYSWSTFRKAVASALPEGRVIYDLRATFANWMRKAEVDRSTRKLLMGHSQRDVLDGYETPGDRPEWGDWEHDVQTARRRLRKYIRNDLRQAKAKKMALHRGEPVADSPEEREVLVVS